MRIEQQLADFVCHLKAEQIPASAQRIVRLMVQAVIGTGVAGAAEDGIAALRELLRERGGTPQATTLVFGDRLPACAAAQFNATLCSALDYCDAMAPGPHIGSSLFPAALAAAELVGGCSDAEFMAALAAGAELTLRLNLSEAQCERPGAAQSDRSDRPDRRPGPRCTRPQRRGPDAEPRQWDSPHAQA